MDDDVAGTGGNTGDRVAAGELTSVNKLSEADGQGRHLPECLKREHLGQEIGLELGLNLFLQCAHVVGVVAALLAAGVVDIFLAEVDMRLLIC